MAAADIVVLTDAAATKTAILTELSQLISGLAAGDCGYFHFSGHGVRMASTDPEEPDARDEALCPYEFDWTPGTTIVDNEVLTILDAVPRGARIVFTIDSCHSGDFARFAPIPNSRPRTIAPPPGVLSTRGPTRAGFRAAGLAPNATFVSACSPWQTAADTSFGGRPNGAFTHYFLQQVTAAPTDMTLVEDLTAIEPSLSPYEMTPVAENGGFPYVATVRATNGKRGLVKARAIPLARRVIESRAAPIVFEQAWNTSVIGLNIGVGVRIAAMNGELTMFADARTLGRTLSSPPIPTTGNLMYPMRLPFFGMRIVFTISDWTYAPLAVRFMLEVDLASDLAFVPGVRVARVPIHIDLSASLRDLETPAISSPADLLALLTLRQMHEGRSEVDSVEAARIRTNREPGVQVFAAGVASWGPNWREDRTIRPFADRPRPGGIIRWGLPVAGPQRGNGNVYVIGWNSDQESDFDFKLHIGNNFFGGWGEIDWYVEGTYAVDDPFPRGIESRRPGGSSTPARSRPRPAADDTAQVRKA